MKNIRIVFAILLGCCVAACTTENASKLTLWYEQPADEWMKALPLGNGRLGAMVYGGTNTEKVALNEVTLWSGQYDENQETPCGKEQLTEIRKLFFEGKLAEGNQMAAQYLSGQPHSFGTNLPMGDLILDFKYDDDQISAYKRELNIENAVSSVSFQAGNVKYKREYFCSNPDDVLMIKLSADKKAALNFDVKLDLLRNAEVSTSGDELRFSGKVDFPKLGPGGVQFDGKIKILLQGGSLQSEQNALKIENADEAVVIVDLRTDFKNPEYKELCAQTIEKAGVKKYEELKQAHITDYSRLFSRTEMFLGKSDADNLPTDVRRLQLREGKDDAGLFSLFFQYGRYLLISSSRENSPLPAHLQGIWNDNLACNMPWTCDYHLDINTEQNYWLSNIGNLPECNAPLFRYITDLSGYGEKTAMKVYGSPGWTAHTVANVWGYTAPGQSHTWGLFPTAGAWIASHLWEHFTYTQDVEFLKNEAYPVLKKTADFLLDYMVENPNNGFLMTGPSISPENSFKENGQEYALSMMPTCDRVLAYEIFTSCIESSKILGMDNGFRQSLETALAKFPPFKIGKNGGIQEWFEDYDEAHPNHRHTTHLLALYPYNQISLDKTPELAKAAEKTIQLRLASEGWEDVEWSRANFICFYTRLKDSAEAYKNLKSLLVEFSRENMFTMAPAGIASAESDIFEFDANEAAPAAMAEMLIQSHNGYIEFLPTLPAQWNTGYFKGLCVKGGATVDLDWNQGTVKSAKITATANHSFLVKLPVEASRLKIMKNGKEFTFNQENAFVTLDLQKGDVVNFKIS